MRWWSRKARERDLERELRAHLDAEEEELHDCGVPAEEVRHAARRAFGNLTATQEEVRRTWGWTTVEAIIAEIRYAFRSLWKSPGFATMVVLTLALGIGASTVVFTLVDSVLLKPLTYRDSGLLVVAWEHIRFLGNDPVAPNPRHVDVWQNRATAFSAFTVFRHAQVGLSAGGDRPQLTGAVHCLPNLFDVLQVQPQLGRTFRHDDGMQGRGNAAVLTHSSWQRTFHGDRQIVGKTIRIDETPMEVIGVLPPGFHFPTPNTLQPISSRQPKAGLPEPAVFLPVVFNYAEFEWNGNYGNWTTIGRLKPGALPKEAEAQVNTILSGLAQDVLRLPPEEEAAAWRASLQPMQEAVAGASRTTLWFLLAAVLGLMLIACLNLANAQLGRAFSRRRDAAVRTALGAAKWRLLWNGLAENLVLAAIGGTAGVLLAAGALKLMRGYSPVDLPRLSEVQLNNTVLAFAAALVIAASVLSGLLPAVRTLRTDPQVFLHGSRTSFGTRSGARLRFWLVGFQVFGCTVLLLITGLFARSLFQLLHQEKGFDTSGAAIAEVKLPVKVYSVQRNRIEVIDRVLRSLRDLPGVEAAGLVSATPLQGESWIESLHRADRPEMDGVLINARWTSPGYFEVTRQRLVAGRFFEERDRDLDNAVLSESSARALWGDGQPVGGEVHILGRKHNVIGIVADSRMTSLKTAPVKTAYVHYKYRTPYTTSFIVRGRGVEALIPGIRQAIWNSAPDVTIAQLKTFDSQLSDSVARERLQTIILISLGGAALLLAMLGIYGVLSYSVAARKQEIGVRMALGASRSSVYGLTLAQAAAPVCIGLAAGLAASVLAARWIRKFLYGIEAVDPVVMAVVAGVFIAAAAAAALVPARRAAAVDPMTALRAE